MMEGNSKNFETVVLKSGKSYFVADALYFEDIKPFQALIGIDNWEEKLAKEAFPHADFPFTIINFCYP